MEPKHVRWRVAAVQMTSTEDRGRNLAVAEYLARMAVDGGAKLVAFPEHFSRIPEDASPREGEDIEGPLVAWLRNLAAELGCHLLAGSFSERIARSQRVHNTSVLVAPGGEILAVYRKIHLFDAKLRGRALYRESDAVVPGNETVVAVTPLGRLGLSVCYDLRFPELYRHLAADGAEVIFVPSAFTAYTGRDHWMPLLRARAIENQCWVVAPAQTGRHNARRTSHGHSVVIDPWGSIVALLEQGEGVVSAEVDLERARRIRTDMPCLLHSRPDLLGRAGRIRSAEKSRARR